jgi:hypothetical protein
MAKRTQPPIPEDLSLTSAFREISTRHAVLSTYKGSITIQLPGGDYHWFDLCDAKAFHEKLGRVIARRAQLDAWHLKHDPRGYEAVKIRGQRKRNKRMNSR